MACSKQRKTTEVKRRVFLVDDHPILREGISTLVNDQDDLIMCGEAADAPEAMAALDVARPDIVIVDLSLVNSDGLELIRDIKAVKPDLFVLVLSAHDEEHYAERSIAAGAMSYVMKSQQKHNLLDAIRHVLQGQIYLSKEITSKILAKLARSRSGVSTSPVELLTDRELEILRLMGHGLTTGEIADKLRMSAKTVQRHRDNMKAKLDISNATKLQHFAFQWAHSSGDN